MRHLESATRGTHVPPADFFASYWRYQLWIFGGDPYFSPNLSLGSRDAARCGRRHEPSAADRLSVPLGPQLRGLPPDRRDAGEADMLAGMCRATDADVAGGRRRCHAANAEPFPVRTVNWFLPDIDSPFYGGHQHRPAHRRPRWPATTASRTGSSSSADGPTRAFFRSALAAAFPALAAVADRVHDGSYASHRSGCPRPTCRSPPCGPRPTRWRSSRTRRRKFYLVQDFEPMFYPAGTLYALAEETYRARASTASCNTENMRELYRDAYGGKGMSFMPAVDPTVFHAAVAAPSRTPATPVTVFVYARPGHWRNCWELASLALEEVKRRLGDRVRIVTAGSWARARGPAGRRRCDTSACSTTGRRASSTATATSASR